MIETLAMLLWLGSSALPARVLAIPARESAALALDEALAMANAANTRLPVAALDVRIARARYREARAERRSKVRFEGELFLAPDGAYDPTVTDLGQERLQVVAERPLYDGGARTAAIRGARATADAEAARYRQTVADVDLAVRRSYAAFLAAEGEVAVREAGLDRLRGYADLLEARARGGEPVAASLLRTRVRLSTEEADLLDARSRLDAARVAVNGWIGRPPDGSLALVPRPPPSAPEPPRRDDAPTAPGILAAQHEVLAADADLTAAEAESRPRIGIRADAGLWGADTTRLVPEELRRSHPDAHVEDRLRRDLGYSLTLTLGWPLFDGGATDARIARARMASERARRAVDAEVADARVERTSARLALEHAYERYRFLDEAVPIARDGYLDAESRYRGGAASDLEVLDAFSAAIDAEVGRIQAELAFREAEASLERWGGGP